MANKKEIVISLRLHEKPTTRPPITFIMPEGCVGIMFAFKSKKMAKKFDGKEVDYVIAELMDREDKDNG